MKPSLQRTHSLQGSCLEDLEDTEDPEDTEDLEERAGSYMVEQTLSSMKKTAASSCRTAMVIFRPKTFSRPMFSGTTEDTRTEDGSRQLTEDEEVLRTYGPPPPDC